MICILLKLGVIFKYYTAYNNEVTISLNKFSLLTAAAAALLFSCAHQSTPGGGPEDTTPPEVTSTIPDAGRVEVDTKSSIEVNFSEWIDPKSATKAVRLYPIQSSGQQINVSGSKLEIIPDEPLRENTTYHVNISTSLRDLRGNSINRPVDIIFSTGPALDSAVLEGCVLSPSPLTVLPKVGLFRHDSSWSDSNFYSDPDYMTQTDSTGYFHFQNLKEGNYRIISFHDRNSDGKLGLGDPCFSSLEKKVAIRSVPRSVELYPVDSDSLPPRLSAVRAVDRYVVRCSWNKRFDSERFSPAQWKIHSGSTQSESPAIKRTVHLTDEKTVFLILQDSLMNEPYLLSYDFDSESDTLRFGGTTLADTVSPGLVSYSPRGICELTPDVKLFWSEPVRFNQSVFTAIDTLGDSVSFFCGNRYSDTSVITPSRKLEPGREYQITIPVKSVKDIAGNSPLGSTPEDSTLAVRLTTVSADSLCYVMKGGADCFSHHKKRKWTYQPFGRPEHFTVKDSAGHFTYDSIPASKGFLSWFIDENNDNRPTPGRLVPWKAPEPHVVVPDTVEARARWEIENIQVNTCEPCSRPKP
ncbi:MAG: Ig-like domain-containing protein [Chitinispirillaceae bacterium]